MPTTMPTTLPLMLPNINTTFGAIFIGNIVGAVLFGITTLQTFMYFTGNHKDHWLFRTLIGFLWILDTVHIVFMTQGVYRYLILNFMNISDIVAPPWTFTSQVIITCVTDLIVRCIFARRIWSLSGHNKPLLFSVIVTSLVVFGSGMAYAIRAFIDISFVNILHESWLLYTALASGVFGDVLITTSICALLNHNRSGFKSCDSLINTLMVYTINTGILTSLCAMTCLVSFAVWPHTFIFVAIFFVLGKVYVNTILAVLNTRPFLRRRKMGVSTIPQSPSVVEPLSFAPTLANGHVITEPPQTSKVVLQHQYESWISV